MDHARLPFVFIALRGEATGYAVGFPLYNISVVISF